MATKERLIFGMDEVNESDYRVRGTLEVDWSEGKSCMQHRRLKNLERTAKPKAYIKHPLMTED